MEQGRQWFSFIKLNTVSNVLLWWSRGSPGETVRSTQQAVLAEVVCRAVGREISPPGCPLLSAQCQTVTIEQGQTYNAYFIQVPVDILQLQ